MTRVVNTAEETCDVYIGRPGPWGNPFAIKNGFTRYMAIRAYEDWIKTQPALLARLPELKGKRLGCYCAPLPCHGDILVKLVEEGSR